MVLLKDFFLRKLKSSKKTESLQDEGSDTKFSYQMLPWFSFKFLVNKINLIVAQDFLFFIFYGGVFYFSRDCI